MFISSKDWKNYIERLSALDKKAGDLMREWIAKHGFTDTKAMTDYAFALAQKYGEGSAALSAEMYDAVAEMQGKLYPPAEAMPPPDYGEVAKTVNGILKHSQNPNSVANGVSRLVKRTGADTTLNNALRDGAEFAWVPNGDTCAFCITLASRGWQRMSKNALKNGHAEHIHANCDCTYSIRFDGKSGVAGYDPQKYRDMYYGTEGDTPKERINSLRRMHYEQNKDVINAQKRLAYLATSNKNHGIIYMEIDELVPCLRDVKTGQLVDTTVSRVYNRSELKGYNKKNGWYVDWSRTPKDVEIYKVCVKGDTEIQGLLGIRCDDDHKAVYLHWGVVAPHNNPQLLNGQPKKYSGVGGHLAAIAAERSIESGYGGAMYGFAANKDLVKMYCEKYNAEHLPIEHPYEVFYSEKAARDILKVYDYEWDRK